MTYVLTNVIPTNCEKYVCTKYIKDIRSQGIRDLYKLIND